MILEVSVTVGGGVTTVLMKVLHTIPFVDSLRPTVFLCSCVFWFCFAEYLTRVSLTGILELGNSVL